MQSSQTIPTHLRFPDIFKYWLPLAFSWILMSFEPPFINGAIARLGEAERMIAAFGIVYAISLVIESPVISLLPTSTALARSEQNYCTIRRFTIHLVLLTTALHLLVAWTPLFDVVVIRVMNAPEDLVEPVRLGLKMMTFWSGAIAWRRLMQGIMIRNGQTKFIGRGTVVRLVTSAGLAAGLALFSGLPGIAVGTIALASGVIAESGYAHLAARNTIQKAFFSPGSPNTERLSYLELVRFQIPLALSNIIYLAASPLITTALARGINPINDLAAWPVVNSMLFMLRAPAVALPEAVIALYQGLDKEKPLRRFSRAVGLGLSGLLLLISITPLAVFYFSSLIGLSTKLTEIAIPAAQAGVLLPLMTALLYHYRGVLTAEKKTLPITIGMVVELAVMCAVLFGGISLGISGVAVAAIALTAGIAVDALLLLIYLRSKQEGTIHEVYNPGHS